MTRGHADRLLVEPPGARRTPLPAVGRVGRFRRSTQQPELLIGWECAQRLVQQRAVRRQPAAVVRRAFGCHLRRTNLDMAPVVVAGREGLGAIQGRTRVVRRVQLGIGDGQAEVRHRQLRIEPQRLVERARRLNPRVRVQGRQALIVKGLRLARRREHRVVRRADARAQRDRAIQELVRNDGNRVGRVRLLGEADPRHRHDERQRSLPDFASNSRDPGLERRPRRFQNLCILCVLCIRRPVRSRTRTASPSLMNRPAARWSAGARRWSPPSRTCW